MHSIPAEAVKRQLLQKQNGKVPKEVIRGSEPPVRGRLLYGNRLGQVAGLVHVAPPHHGNVVGKQLERNGSE